MRNSSTAAVPTGRVPEKLLSPKTVGDTGRPWTALTERDFVILGEVECLENWPRAWCCNAGWRGHIETLLKKELRQDLSGILYMCNGSANKETRV